MRQIVSGLIFVHFIGHGSGQQGNYEDYCALLGEDDIQGLKHGFLAGNKVYYMGGKNMLFEDETLGLTHPFFHDLRSRGAGIAYHEGRGTGNDNSGREFYKYTKVAYGSLETDNELIENPRPTRMFWRPDKMVAEYEIDSNGISGIWDGWCENWLGGGSGDHWQWVDIGEDECFAKCDEDPLCNQANHEINTETGLIKCWLGLNLMFEEPRVNRCDTCLDRCYGKPHPVTPVNIKEEKFISGTDVVATIIRSDRPVRLQISGRSFAEYPRIVETSASCSLDVETNAVRVHEAGTVWTYVSYEPNLWKVGRLVYDNMWGVLSASRPLHNVSLYEVSEGVCGYTFTLELDSEPTTLAWTMRDSLQEATDAVGDLLEDPESHMAMKTQKLNDQLNNIVPYFRCSDPDVVKVYYYLWSLHLLYYTQGDSGMQTWPHTQTAVNNFLGMHRYDAVFQIMVGAWANPAHHEYYANGNVLCWSELLPFQDRGHLPDNFGIDWASDAYGTGAIGHVQGAWLTYQHSGNTTFLRLAYDFYRELFWDGIHGKHWDYAFDSVLCLNKMASVLGQEEDALHWNETVGMENLQYSLNNRWNSSAHMFGLNGKGVAFGNIAPAANSQFPRDWVVQMAEHWMDDSEKGFNSWVPLTSRARQDWLDENWENFAITPGSNWYMIRPLYIHSVDRLANKFTLRHLTRYNMQGGVPVAPETRNLEFKMLGDSYSNINAGKILLVLEGIGGLSYSVDADTFSFADNLPSQWQWMEFRVPVIDHAGQEHWVKARADREQSRDGSGIVEKRVTVEVQFFHFLFFFFFNC